MDAKPQRPLRAVPFSTIGNENMAPVKQPPHNRHKSAGNLKAAPPTAGLDIGTKRAAFVDVSNTSKAYADKAAKDQAKDRMGKYHQRVKPASDKENQPFLRPAQRPLSQASKQTSAASSHTTTSLSTSKPAIEATTRLPPMTKFGVSKKAAAVYKDRTDGEQDVEQVSVAKQHPTAESQPVKNPRSCRSQPQLKPEQPVLRRTQSRYLTANNPENLEHYDDDATEASYEDALEDLPRTAETIPGTADADPLPHVSKDVISTTGRAPPSERYSQVPAVVPSTARLGELAGPPAASEPEEYWDEDEEGEEYYDEIGYTTAHSYRSHGDNTTGGATTLVAPRITAKVRKELEMARQYVESNRTEDEVEEEAWDVSMVAEYGEDIFEYLRNLEATMSPNPHYMDIQTEIQWSMRSILMDWLVQVHQRFSLLPETLFLAVNCIDRFLSVKIVSLGKLQLVGATAIFVAAKYEEINCPSVQEIVYMVNEGYSAEEILKAERFMLSMLQFELGWPGPMSFLRRISKADEYDLETRTLAKYFLEVTIVDERFVGCAPSFVAAGAHCLARLMLKKGDWTPAHVHYSGYTMGQLKALVAMILECCQDPKTHHCAVFEKYSSTKYKCASVFVRTEVKRGYALPSTLGSSRYTQTFDERSASIYYGACDTGHAIPGEA